MWILLIGFFAAMIVVLGLTIERTIAQRHAPTALDKAQYSILFIVVNQRPPPQFSVMSGLDPQIDSRVS